MKKLVILFLALISYVYLFAADGINNQLSCNIYWTTKMYSTFGGYQWNFQVNIFNHSAKIITITNIVLRASGMQNSSINDVNGDFAQGSNKSFSRMISNRYFEPQLPACDIYYTLDGVEYVKKSDDGISTFNLSEYSINVRLGETYQLTTDSSDPITWSSEDTQIATVDSKGVISGLSENVTVVNAMSSDGTFMASCRVNVVNMDNRFSIQSTAILYVDETAKLSYTILSEELDINKISWKSSNEEVATVDAKGVVSAKSYGQTIITASSDMGDLGKCIVTVKKHTLTITANNVQKVYGDENPLLTLSYSGFANGDSENSITKPTIICDAKTNSNVGEYTINLSGGKSDKYELILVPGILTVKKALLVVSVGNYFKHPGEDNPPFSIKYTGFKCGDTKNDLIKEPTIECNADKNSAIGVYDIIVNGGEAHNYEFQYENGKLHVGELSLTITTSGNGSVSCNGKSIQGKDVLSVGYGQDVDLEFIPSEGFKLGFAQLNATNITNNINNGLYTIKDIREDMVVIATFEENTGSFTVNGINYTIVSAFNKTVSVGRGSYSGQISIPSTINNNGQTWNVIGLSDFCFYNNQELISIDLPNSLQKDKIGQGLFNNCIGLAAITWNSNSQMTDDMLGAVNNKNLLFYASNASYAPASVKNVVVNGTAKEIVLSDAESTNNFYCPKEFTAEKISYSHRFGMESGYSGQAKGWETIALPFTVSEITHESKGKLLPFGKWTNTSTEKPFWLCKLNSSGFARATTIEANTPYIICMPNNANEYDEEYCLSGNVTFSATNVKVSASNSVATSKSNSKTFIPAFCAQDKSSTVYALNVNNSYHSELGGYTEGSAFVSGLRKVSPFEAYMTTSDSNAKRAFLIDFSEATGIDELPAMTGNEGKIAIYNLSGQHIITTDNGHISEVKAQLPAGIYIINGKKTVIKR